MVQATEDQHRAHSDRAQRFMEKTRTFVAYLVGSVSRVEALNVGVVHVGFQHRSVNNPPNACAF